MRSLLEETNQFALFLIPFLMWGDTHPEQLNKNGPIFQNFHPNLLDPLYGDLNEEDKNTSLNIYKKSKLAKMKDAEDFLSTLQTMPKLLERYNNCKNNLDKFEHSFCEAEIAGYQTGAYSNTKFIKDTLKKFDMLSSPTSCQQKARKVITSIDFETNSECKIFIPAKEIAISLIDKNMDSILKREQERNGQLTDLYIEFCPSKYLNKND